jgi:hypothetical protein
MVKVVNLAGPQNVGKTTTAKELVESFRKLYPHIDVVRAAYADALYGLTHYLTGVSETTLRSQEYKNTLWNKDTSPMPCLIGWTPRKFLQIVGTECFRNHISDLFWVQSTLRLYNNCDLVIMEDARFPNEYEAGDITIELQREGVDYTNDHASAMKPDSQYIDWYVLLQKDINYDTIVQRIYKQLWSNK